MQTLDHLATVTGVGKRMMMALNDIGQEQPQLEDALYQLGSVIDAIAKRKFPNVSGVRDRFQRYVDSIMTDVYFVTSGGQVELIGGHFINKDGDQLSFGEILYGIRCSSYHDPEEVDDLIMWGGEDPIQIGHEGIKFIINRPLINGLSLILLTEEEMTDLLPTDLVWEESKLVIKSHAVRIRDLIGQRGKLMDLYKADDGQAT